MTRSTARSARRILLAAIVGAGVLGLAEAGLSAHEPSATAAATPKSLANWAGFEFRSGAPNIETVTGSFIVPRVYCTASPANQTAGIWVGLGGDTAPSDEAGDVEWLYQTGVELTCKDNRPSYYAWVEEYDQDRRLPFQKVTCNNTPCTVQPGDTIDAGADLAVGGAVSISEYTPDHRMVFILTHSYPRPSLANGRVVPSIAGSHTAECVVEGPFAMPTAALADFNAVRFQLCDATASESLTSGILSVSLTDPALPLGWSESNPTLTRSTGSAVSALSDQTVTYIPAGSRVPPPACNRVVRFGDLTDVVITKRENTSCSLARSLAYNAAFGHSRHETLFGFSCAAVSGTESTYLCRRGDQLVGYLAE